MPVLLQIDENPNCEPMDAQVFQCRTPMGVVTHVSQEEAGEIRWCPITGIDENGKACPATACTVDDSGDGACYLVVGGDWGLRLRRPDSTDSWDLADASQWGVSYLLLAATADSVKWAES